jgi:hypothetical protein
MPADWPALQSHVRSRPFAPRTTGREGQYRRYSCGGACVAVCVDDNRQRRWWMVASLPFPRSLVWRPQAPSAAGAAQVLTSTEASISNSRRRDIQSMNIMIEARSFRQRAHRSRLLRIAASVSCVTACLDLLQALETSADDPCHPCAQGKPLSPPFS